MNRYGILGLAALLGMVIASPVAAQKTPVETPPEKKTATRGNILLITVDSLRADRLDPYIGKSDLTPTIGELAARGVMFSRAYTASPSTAPSNATMLTGYYPSRHRIRHDLGGYLADGIMPLAERLRLSGYRTGAVVGSFHLDSDRRLDRGFDSYDDDIEGISWRFATKSMERRAEDVIGRGVRFVDDAPAGKLWFLWLNLYDPHYNYGPIEGIHAPFSEEAYRREIAHVDAQIARLQEALRSRELQRNTHIILAGSHGEGMGDHDETGHGVYLFDTTIRVPLIIVKAGTNAARGTTFDAPVSLADVTPTVIALAELEEDGSLDGRSLAPVLKADGAAAAADGLGNRKLFVEAVHPHEAYGWSPLFAVVHGHHKIVQGRWLEAFDLRADPGERMRLDPVPGWAASLVSLGRERLGDLQPSDKIRETILDEAEALQLPWDNSPICLDKQEWPDPRDPERLRLHGQLFEARVNFDQKAIGLSFQTGVEILEDDPANYTALEMIIYLYVRNNFMDMIPDVLEIFQCNYPFRVAPYHYYGHSLDRNGRLAEAEQAYRMLGRIDPLYEEAPYDLAAIYARTDRKDEAFAALQKAIELGATDYEFIRNDSRFASISEDPRFEGLIPAR